MAKKEKKSKIKIKISAQKLAILMAIIAGVSFAYKMTVAALAVSLLMMISALPTLFVFISKAVYAKNMNQTRKQKLTAYLVMTIAATAVTTLFVLFSSLKVGGIDITIRNRFEGWIGIVFIFFIIVMFVLSIINLKGALVKDDLVVKGIKEITFLSALADAIMIQEFIDKVILKYVDLPFMDVVNKVFPLAVTILMVMVPVFMFKRYLRERKTEKIRRKRKRLGAAVETLEEKPFILDDGAYENKKIFRE